MSHSLPVRLPILGITAASFLLFSCGKDELPDWVESKEAGAWIENGPVAAGLECNPISPEWDCLYPFPSNLFLKKDASRPGGFAVDMPDAVLPSAIIHGEEVPVNFYTVHPTDGFSVGAQIGVRIPGGISRGNLVFHTGDVGVSKTAASTTQIIDAETGERVLHFAELDVRPDSIDDRILILRPMERMENGRRYVVVLRDLEHPDGTRVEVPANFQKLRSGNTKGDPKLERLGRYFDSYVFPVIESADVNRSDVLLAWDFTTETEESVAGDMYAIRADAIARMEANPPGVRVTSVRPVEDRAAVAFEINGVLTGVPLYMKHPDSATNPAVRDWAAGTRIHRGEDGKPAYNGDVEVPFIIRVPQSVVDPERTRPVRMIQYGHGFFGGRDELRASSVDRFSSDLRTVVMAVDWWGMASEDAVSVIANIFNGVTDTMTFTDRTHQGMVNFIASTYAAKGALLEVDELRVDDEPIYDPNQIYYYGISQGHILGGTYVALAPHIDKAVFSVGGANYAFMMSRARPFLQFLAPIETQVGWGDRDGKAEAQRVVHLLQSAMDRIDPITYAPRLRTNTLPNSPAKREVLLQIGIGDAQVSPLSAHMHARAMDVPHLLPAPRPIYGLVSSEGPLESAIQEFDFHIDPEPGVEAEAPATDNVAHEGVRRLSAAILQKDRFLRPDGEIRDFCNLDCTPVPQ